MSKKSVKILVAGNYCHDTLLNDSGRFDVLGGSASYISAVLEGLGADFSVSAKTGPDFLYTREVNSPPLVSKGAKTTHFLDDTRTGSRVSFLLARCEELRAEEISVDSCEIALASAVAGEVTAELLAHLRKISRILICDGQGLIRATTAAPENRVIHVPITETPFARSLSLLDYLKVSEREARMFDLPSLPRTLTVFKTLGARGCELIRAGESRHFPAVPALEVDPTGAGDCFVAGFAEALSRGLPVERALEVGARLGALAVSTVGVPRQNVGTVKFTTM
jgi:1D-myo-inositol 3-kinase